MNEVRLFDVDIDVQSTTVRENYGTKAMIYNKETERVLPHQSGVYLESVPVDTLTGWAAFDYEYGDEHGFLKVDILTNRSYDMFRSKAEVVTALNQEPEWNKLLDESFVKKLPHIANHFDLVKKVKPQSIEELADVLALMRPSKIHMTDQYLKNRTSTRRRLYLRPADGIFFKKSHAIAYAAMITVVMNKLTNSSLISWQRSNRS